MSWYIVLELLRNYRIDRILSDPENWSIKALDLIQDQRKTFFSHILWFWAWIPKISQKTQNNDKFKNFPVLERIFEFLSDFAQKQTKMENDEKKKIVGYFGTEHDLRTFPVTGRNVTNYTNADWKPPARIELATLRLLSACSARLSYRGICSRPGSNWRPWDYETHALPTAPQELVMKHNGTLRSHHTVRLM